MTVAACLIVPVLPLTAEVVLAEGGQARGVIVHNGHDELVPPMSLGRDKAHMLSPAYALQAYLRQMSGAELPLVGSLADAGDKPAIVLELVDRVGPGSERTRYRATGVPRDQDP